MAETMLVLGISGSLRAGSYNTRLLRAAACGLPPEAEFRELAGLDRIPPHNQDLDLALGPEPVRELRQALRRADAVLIATPEYNHSIPGQLKNALDWASRPFPANSLRGRPVAVVGASTSIFGAVWARRRRARSSPRAGPGCSTSSCPWRGRRRRSTPTASFATPRFGNRLAEITGELVGAAAVPELTAA